MRRRQICFFFNAQRHQILHGIGIAVELARNPAFEVYVVSPAEGHVEYARTVADRLGGAPITFVHVRSRLLEAAKRHTGSVVPPKLLTLAMLARWLDGFDAIAIPERTSTLLRRMGVKRPCFIHLDHGAGDRAAGFDRRIRHFDFVLMAGPKHRERLMAERLIVPGAHAVVGYPKFEAADAIRDTTWNPFADDRPIVLYNPHFSPIGSWEDCAAPVLEAFAGQDRYNLIVAPHVRLLDGYRERARWSELLGRHASNPRIHIDTGSDRAIDMTHTMLADIYIGDVSSQVYEFLRRPRPCLFLNPHGVDWKDDDNYAHWHFGPVLVSAADILDEVDRVVADQGNWLPVQQDGFARTFLPEGGAACAAAAIARHLRQDRIMREAPRRHARRVWGFHQRKEGVSPFRRAAVFLTLLASAWLVHGAVGPTASVAADNPFLDRVIASHRTTQMRQEMRSQIESIAYDPAEIRHATGIVMPALPANWGVRDVQVYPSTFGDIVQLYLKTPDGEGVSLVSMKMETSAEGEPLLQTRNKESIAYWEMEEFAYALVGELGSARLLTLAAGLAKESADRRVMADGPTG